MQNPPDPKTMAQTLRAALATHQIDISDSLAAELVQAQLGAAPLDGLAGTGPNSAAAGPRFYGTRPVLRIFDDAKAREFYVEFLGFTWDWEHRFGETFPLYAQVSRAGLVIHLSGHHGDATPGATAVVLTSDVQTYQKELAGRDYRYNKPGIEDLPWGLVMTVTDPFSNRIRFTQPKPASPSASAAPS